MRTDAPVSVRPVAFGEIEAFRDMARAEAGCQIVRDSILQRGLGQSFVIESGEVAVGYAGVWSEYFPGRVMAFHLVPWARPIAETCFRELLRVSEAGAVEAQTNLPQLHAMLLRFGEDVEEEKILFEDGEAPSLSVKGVSLRKRRRSDGGPDGEWVLDRDGTVVAAGGFLTHYNPPYADLYMEVVESERRRGLGSYLIQELGVICRSKGLLPAARCSITNEASRRTLLRGGMIECGRLVAARVSVSALAGPASEVQ